MNEYERFVELYNSPMTIKRLIETMGINNFRYSKYRKRALEENKINLRKSGNRKRTKRTIKNIHRSDPVYNYYNIKHKGEYFCGVKGYRNAERIVERLEACDWDKSQVSRIKREVLSES